MKQGDEMISIDAVVNRRRCVIEIAREEEQG
jgi:hypothetical protein